MAELLFANTSWRVALRRLSSSSVLPAREKEAEGGAGGLGSFLNKYELFCCSFSYTFCYFIVSFPICVVSVGLVDE